VYLIISIENIIENIYNFRPFGEIWITCKTIGQNGIHGSISIKDSKLIPSPDLQIIYSSNVSSAQFNMNSNFNYCFIKLIIESFESIAQGVQLFVWFYCSHSHLFIDSFERSAKFLLNFNQIIILILVELNCSLILNFLYVNYLKVQTRKLKDNQKRNNNCELTLTEQFHLFVNFFLLNRFHALM